MAIDWYPGHMSKARREIADALKGIDVVIEVLDARLPASSANPMLRQILKHKPCIKVLNKNDLADPAVTREWVKHFERESSVRALPLEAKARQTATTLPKLCRALAPHRGVPGKSLWVMIVGIPNVGKSTLINTLAGKSIARVGDKPAITTCQQKIDLRNGIFLCDTPGLLWPDLRRQAGAFRLAASGAIGEGGFDTVEVGLFAAELLARRYPEPLLTRYKLGTLPETPLELIEEIGRRRGCLVSGGTIDRHRAAEVLLRDLRGGQLGRLSLETPADLLEQLAETDEPLEADAPGAES